VIGVRPSARRAVGPLLTTLVGLVVFWLTRPLAAQPQLITPDLTPVAERASAAPGSTVRLALSVSLPAGYHVQSNQPREASLIPTKLWILAPAGITATEVVFPASTDLKVAGFDQLVAVFEREFAIGVEVAIDKSVAAGDLVIPARLRYQACNDLQCLSPRTLETSWTIHVGAAAATAHPDLFNRIAFGKGMPPPTDPPPAVSKRPVPGATTPAAAGGGLARLDQFTIASAQPGSYMNVADFLTFIHNAEAGIKPAGLFEGRGPLAIVAIVFFGGLALNLTPCVLPMVPINLAIIGAGTQAGRQRRGFLLGAAYGGAMTLVYGLLGVIVILTAGAFGAINASPWFNLGIAVLFVVLALAMFDVLVIDFSRLSSRIRFGAESRGTLVLAFSMGAVTALLAGACVAPVVIQVVLFASDLYSKGTPLALTLPFFLGLGMAVPWPIAGAGLASLPKPGMWMVRVKQVFGVFILATAAYYGYLAYELFANRWVDPASVEASVQAQLKEGWYASLDEGLAAAARDRKPVLIDMWATWCKNCLVMDKTTLADAQVKSALAGYTKIKVQAEDLDAPPASTLMKRFGAIGLPAYVILKPK
jgi:cytochrome c biogenesis protein CcdA